MKSKTKTIGGITVGRPVVKPTAPSHVRGVFQGNHPHPTQRHKGIDHETQTYADATARRSTGIRAKHHDPIDPRMPKLSPA